MIQGIIPTVIGRVFIFLMSVAISFSAISCSKNSTEDFGTPRGLSASDGSFVDRVQVKWDSVSGAEKYKIYRSASADGTYQYVGAETSTTYDDYDALPQGMVFYYKATAWSSIDGESGFSNDDSGSTGVSNSLSTPTINVTPAAAKIDVSWNQISGATKYYIYRQGPSDADFAPIASVTSLTYADTTAEVGIVYDYKVRAWSANGYSNYSGILSGQIGSALAAPTGVLATQTQTSQITVTWTASAGASSYKIWRAASSAGAYALIASGVSGTSYNDNDLGVLIQGKYYYYTVQAVATGQTSAMSAPFATGMVLPTLSSPVINATSGPGSVVLSWSAVSGATDYDVYRSTNASGPFSFVVSTSALNSSDIPPSPNIVYYYQVKARNSDGTSVPSNVASGYRGAATDAPLPPTNLDASTTNAAQIDLTWTASVSTKTGYIVYRSTDGITFTSLATPGVVTAYTDSTAINGQNYWYRISTVNGSTEGAVCVAATGMRPVALATPTVSVSGTTLSSVTLTISATGTTRYVYRSLTSGSGYTLIGNTASTSFSDTSVSASTTYYYKVRAYSSASGYSDYCAFVSGTTSAVQGTPVLNNPSTTFADHVAITWPSVAGATFYLYRRSSTGTTDTLLISTTAASYDDYNVVQGEVYSYKLQAYTAAGGYSALSAAKTGNTTTSLSAPSGVAATDGSSGGDWNHVRVTSSTVSGGTVYYVYRSTSATGSYIYIGNTATPATGVDDLTSSSTPPSYATEYYYKVKAYGTNQFSVDSSPDTGHLQNPPMTGILASDGSSAVAPVSPNPDTTIRVSWPAVSYANTYYVYRSDDAYTASIATVTAPTTTYDDSSITQSTNGGVQYGYKVVSRTTAFTNTTGDVPSTSADTGYLRLYAVTGVAASDGTGGTPLSGAPKTTIAISWTAVANATGYTVYRDTAVAGAYATSVGSFVTNSGTDTPPSDGVRYYYKVVATNALGANADSIKASSTNDSGYLQYSAPAMGSVSQGSSTTAITVQWTGRTNADSYDVYRATSAGGPYTNIFTAYPASPYTDNDAALTPGTDYYYKVTAHRSTFTNDTSDVADCVASGNGYIKLVAPTSFTATASATPGQIDFTWVDSAGADQFEVFYGTTPGGPYPSSAGTAATSSLTGTGFTTGTLYYFVVHARNTSQSSSESGDSAGSSATAP